MSSSYSIARTFNEFIPPIDLDFMVKAMAMKQQNYDQNYAALQAEVEAIGNLDIAKDVDRKYLYDKTSMLIKQINNYGSVDLSSNGIARQIKGQIKKVIDDDVVNAVLETKRMRDYQSQVKEIKEKKPDQYSLMNEVYGFRPIQAWLEDETVGAKMKGTPRYVPFTDVQKKYTDLMKEMEATQGSYKVQVPDPKNPGYMVEKEFAGLEPHEVENTVRGMLSAQDREQLRIDGWYKFSNASPEYAKEKLKDHSNTKLDEIDGKIVEYSALVKGATGTRLKQINDSIASLKLNREAYRKSIIGLSSQPSESIGEYLVTEDLIGGLQQMHKRHLKSEQWKKDDTYWADAELKFNKEKHLFEKSQAIKKAEEEAKKGSVVNPDGSVTVVDIPTNTDEPVTVKQPIEIAKELETSLNTKLKSAFISGGLNDKEYDALVKASNAEIDGTGKSIEEALFEKYQNMYGNKADASVSIGAIGMQLQELRRTKKIMKDTDDEIFKIKNSPDAVSKVASEVWDANAGVNVNSKYNTKLRTEWQARYYNKFGRKGTKEQVIAFVSQDEDLSKGLLLQADASKFLEDVTPDLATTGRPFYRRDGADAMAAAYSKVSLGKKQPVLDNVTAYFGEHADVDLFGTPEFTKQAPKTAAYLSQLSSKGGTGISSLSSVKTRNDLMVSKKLREDAAMKLMKGTDLNKAVGFNKENQYYSALDNLAQTSGLNTDGKSVLTVKPVDKDFVEIMQAKTPTEKDPSTTLSVKVSKDNFMKAENGLSDALNLSNTDGITGSGVFVPTTYKTFAYFDESDSEQMEAARVKLGTQAPLAAKKSAYKLLVSQLPEDKYPKEKQVIKTIIDNPQNVRLETTQSKQSGRIFVTAYYNQNGNVYRLGDLPYSQADFNRIEPILFSAPQTFLTNILASELEDNAPSETLTDLTNAIK